MSQDTNCSFNLRSQSSVEATGILDQNFPVSVASGNFPLNVGAVLTAHVVRLLLPPSLRLFLSFLFLPVLQDQPVYQAGNVITAHRPASRSKGRINSLFLCTCSILLALTFRSLSLLFRPSISRSFAMLFCHSFAFCLPAYPTAYSFYIPVDDSLT